MTAHVAGEPVLTPAPDGAVYVVTCSCGFATKGAVTPRKAQQRITEHTAYANAAATPTTGATMTGTATRTTLTQITNTLRALADSYLGAAEMEAAFDGGEWSGPALERGMRTAVAQALREQGWTGPEFLDEVTARTSARWVRVAALDEIVDVQTCTRCGTRELVMDTWTTPGFDSTAAVQLACGCVAL